MFAIILANSSECRLYSFDKKHNDLALLKKLEHKESKMKISELMSDQQGRYQSDFGTQGNYEPRTNPRQEEVEFFMHEIAKEIKTARNHNQFEKIIIFGLPQTNGLLNKLLDKQTQEHSVIINKDYIMFSDPDLIKYLRENWIDIVNDNL